MKKLLIAMFVALLMVGCGEDAPSSSSSSSSDTTEPSKPKTIDFDDNETLDGRIAEAIDGDKLQRGKEGGEIDYAPNGQTPYSGWAKEMHSNGQMKSLVQYKDGKPDGLETGWYQNGQKEYEGNWKDGEQDGLWIFYNEDGTEKSRLTFKDGEVVED
jgi:hypothetical protein